MCQERRIGLFLSLISRYTALKAFLQIAYEISSSSSPWHRTRYLRFSSR
ncbi:hypothetical protein [Rubritalea tangerina]